MVYPSYSGLQPEGLIKQVDGWILKKRVVNLSFLVYISLKKMEKNQIRQTSER